MKRGVRVNAASGLPMTLLDRFEEKYIVIPSGCWFWLGAVKSGGYGSLIATMPSGKKVYVAPHRFSYETFVGAIPDNLTIDHLCNEKLCVNWRHMEPVTANENSRRRHARRAECVRGHVFSEHAVQRSGGGRRCVPCTTERRRLWAEAHPERVRELARARTAKYRARKASTATYTTASNITK